MTTFLLSKLDGDSAVIVALPEELFRAIERTHELAVEIESPVMFFSYNAWRVDGKRAAMVLGDVPRMLLQNNPFAHEQPLVVKITVWLDWQVIVNLQPFTDWGKHQIYKFYYENVSKGGQLRHVEN